MPAIVASKLNKIIANFLWGANSSRAIHWVKWDEICTLKSLGGLGTVEDAVWKLVWAKQAPPKVEAFVWKAVRQRISSFVELDKRGVQNLGHCLCILCREELESSDHLFCQCKVSWEVWQRWRSN
ncbi:hypothetical protein F3Y22_tig00111427pilonHSYRG00503 [Hibiscus syriacus]|uniref:Reverse transcriptase zinc-binding domain-containing protein n=1 Tax=Hibiscus syriacus TaxID=106335 RepID=A0A6A2YKV2_HIBSY|nr:hypothetical protein F3Y22_tig00111427pilonHSYRG00503 [Hibiscus syriacus]